MALEIETKILRGADGKKVIGISLVAGAETYSEDFVGRFPRALLAQKAKVTIEGNKVIFEGPIFTGSNLKFELKLKPEEIAGIKSVLENPEQRLGRDGMLTPGFRIFVDERMP